MGMNLQNGFAIATLLVCVSVASHAATQRTDARITYSIPEGVYVDVGTDNGLSQGGKGTLVFGDGRSLVFEVVQAASKTALLRLEGLGAELVGDLRTLPVELVFQSAEKTDGPPAAEEGARSGGEAETAPFVPLLSPAKQAVQAPRSENVSHGNVGIRQDFLTGTENELDRMGTRLYSSGSIDRLFGSGWSFNWSGSARYRTGDGYREHPEYETVQPLIYGAMLQQTFDSGSFIRLGRFLPLELPGVGYIDGVQLETDPGNHWRFGVVGGLKPSRVNLEATVAEPTITGYATFEAGARGASYYSGTAGLLSSLFKGEPDRLAVLFDQRASLGTRFDLFSTAAIDFGTANTTNSQTQLSSFDLTGSYKLHRNHTLRAGADHWQRTDTFAERDQLRIIDDRLFDDGYWRYWIGGLHRLPLGLSLNEEVAYTVADELDDAMRWRVGLTRTGLFQWPTASAAATVYNLEAMDGSGYGGLLSAYLPFWDSRFSVRPSASIRWIEPENGASELSVSYYALYLDVRLTKAWLLTGGLTQTQGDGADSTLLDLGLRYSW